MRLETARLVIRSPVPSDAASLARLYSDPQVLRFLPPRAEWTLERARQAIAEWSAAERERHYGQLIVERKDSGFIGRCGLQPIARTGPEIEIVYHYIPAVWGQGYGTEAAVAVLDHGFRMVGLERIFALALPENVGSWRIMEKVGMRFVGYDSYYDLDGLKKYVVDRDEWLRAHARDASAPDRTAKVRE